MSILTPPLVKRRKCQNHYHPTPLSSLAVIKKLKARFCVRFHKGYNCCSLFVCLLFEVSCCLFFCCCFFLLLIFQLLCFVLSFSRSFVFLFVFRFFFSFLFLFLFSFFPSFVCLFVCLFCCRFFFFICLFRFVWFCLDWFGLIGWLVGCLYPDSVVF